MTDIFLFSFFSPFVLVLVLTPFAIFLSKRFGIYDYPSRRKVHTQPIPRLGGLAIFLAVILTIIFLTNLFQPFKELLAYEHKIRYKGDVLRLTIDRQLLGIIIGSIVIFLMGLFDDIKSVRTVSKLLIQIIAAYCVMDFGVRIFGLRVPIADRYISFPRLVTQVVTILWILTLMNSINFIDGLNGLASGIVFIISFSFFLISIIQLQTQNVFFQKQFTISAILSLMLSGACLGFLFYNFHPARIFLGDSGALILGYFLGVTSTIGLLKIATVIAFFVPLIIMAVPVGDVMFAVIRRLLKRIPVTKPDKAHIHHLLLSFGWTHREVVLLMYVITLFLSLIAIALSSVRLKI